MTEDERILYCIALRVANPHVPWLSCRARAGLTEEHRGKVDGKFSDDTRSPKYECSHSFSA